MKDVLNLRTAAGLTQAQLAARSGVAQPNIAAYESGRRRASPAMIARLTACLRPRPSEAVAGHRDDIIATLARYGMTGARVFGSASRGTDQPGSDLDLVVDVTANADVLDLIDAAAELEEMLGVGVDIVTSRSLTPDHEIARTAVPL
ncbi:MAG: helix-turn-helix domain-containing protein [Mobilicoccus sp.]|nr:helix-turn-helix domain-containing protein [Mobilicoccus sp.]